MNTFVAICRGRTVADSHLLALSTDPTILAEVANLLLGNACLQAIRRNPKKRKRDPKIALPGDRSDPAGWRALGVETVPWLRTGWRRIR